MTTNDDQYAVENCTNTDESYHLGDSSYPEGYHFCASCGGQFDCWTHGVDVTDEEVSA